MRQPPRSTRTHTLLPYTSPCHAMVGKPATCEHGAKLLLAPSPARLGLVAQRVYQLRRLARHSLGSLAHRRDLAVEHAKGVAPFRLDLAHRVLIFLQPLVDRVQDRKSVVEGKSVSVRVDLGGSRIIKQKIIT